MEQYLIWTRVLQIYLLRPYSFYPKTLFKVTAYALPKGIMWVKCKLDRTKYREIMLGKIFCADRGGRRICWSLYVPIGSDVDPNCLWIYIITLKYEKYQLPCKHGVGRNNQVFSLQAPRLQTTLSTGFYFALLDDIYCIMLYLCFVQKIQKMPVIIRFKNMASHFIHRNEACTGCINTFQNFCDV